jgi:protein ImuB
LRFGPNSAPAGSGPRAVGRTGRADQTSEIVEVRRSFVDPIGAPKTLHWYTLKLVVELAASLEERALGARRLDMLFYCVDNRVEAIRIGTSTPTRDVHAADEIAL